MVEDKNIISKAVVTRAIGSNYEISIDEEKAVAKRAFSCLIEPKIGDIVAIIQAEKECYITAILHREERCEIELNISGDFTINSSGSIKLSSNIECLIESDAISAQSGVFNIKSDDTTLFGSQLNITVDTFRGAGNLLETIFDDTVQKSTNSYEYVEEHKELQTDSLREVCEGSKVTQTRNYVATATDQMRFDAETINLA